MSQTGNTNVAGICSACQYDLRAHPLAAVCPECGNPRISGPVVIPVIDPKRFSPFRINGWDILSVGPISLIAGIMLLQKASPFWLGVVALSAGVGLAVFVLNRLNRLGPPSHELKLDAAGFRLRPLPPPKHRETPSCNVQEGTWLRDDKLTIQRIPATDRVRIRLSRAWPSRMVKSFEASALLSRAQAAAIIQQHELWLAELPRTPPSHDVILASHLLNTTRTPTARESVYEFPLLPPTFPTHPVMILGGLVLVLMVTVMILAVTANGLIVAALVVLLSAYAPSPRAARWLSSLTRPKVLRVATAGYQVCRPGSPLLLRPWTDRKVRLYPFTDNLLTIPSVQGTPFICVVRRQGPLILGLPGQSLVSLPVPVANALDGFPYESKG